MASCPIRPPAKPAIIRLITVKYKYRFVSDISLNNGYWLDSTFAFYTFPWYGPVYGHKSTYVFLKRISPWCSGLVGSRFPKSSRFRRTPSRIWYLGRARTTTLVELSNYQDSKFFFGRRWLITSWYWLNRNVEDTLSEAFSPSCGNASIRVSGKLLTPLFSSPWDPN